MIILHTQHLLFLHFETPCVVCFPNFDEVNVCLKVFKDFFFVCVSNMLLILSLFFSCSRFFDISGNSPCLFLLFVESSLLWLLAVRSSFNGIFLRNSSRRVCRRFFRDYGAYFTSLDVRDGFYAVLGVMTFDIEVLLSVCCWVCIYIYIYVCVCVCVLIITFYTYV